MCRVLDVKDEGMAPMAGEVYEFSHGSPLGALRGACMEETMGLGNVNRSVRWNVQGIVGKAVPLWKETGGIWRKPHGVGRCDVPEEFLKATT